MYIKNIVDLTSIAIKASSNALLFFSKNQFSLLFTFYKTGCEPSFENKTGFQCWSGESDEEFVSLSSHSDKSPRWKIEKLKNIKLESGIKRTLLKTMKSWIKRAL